MGSTGRIAVSVVSIVALVPSLAAQSPPKLFAGEAYQVSNDPLDVVLTDLDGDGDPDVAVAAAMGFVGIYSNDGAGFLTSVAQFTLPNATRAIAAGDTTGDGVPEVLAVTESGSPPRLSTFQSTGPGSYSLFLNYPLGIGAVDMDLGDLNNDGSLDVVLAGTNVEIDLILLNNGTGGYAAPIVYFGGMPKFRHVRVTDANHDGKLDFFQVGKDAYSVGGIVRYHMGAGNGSFTDAYYIFLTGTHVAATFADVNGDGDLDLISGSSSPGFNSFNVHTNDGTGLLVFQSYGNPKGPIHSLVAGDLTGDGNVDFVSTSAQNPNSPFELFAGNGTGSFTSLGTRFLGSLVLAAQVADMDGGGVGDLVGGGNSPPGYRGPGFGVFLADGQGDFEIAGVRTAGWISGIAVGDLNHDGILDLVSAEEVGNPPVTNGVLNARLGTGAGYGAPFTIPAQIWIEKAAIGDFDQDGDPDVVATNNNIGGTLTLAHGNGDGTFGAAIDVSLGGAGNGGKWARIGDFDANGYPDVLINCTGSQNVLLLPNYPGGFGAASAHPAGAVPQGLAIGDLDLDGDLDAAVAVVSTSPFVRLLRNSGAGALSPLDVPAPASFGAGRAVEIQDVNEDGIPDFVLAHHDGEAVTFLGFGGGSWVAGAPVATPDFVEDLTLTDLDRDGHVDLVLAHDVLSTVSVAPGDGTGAFSGSRQFYGTGFCADVVSCDLDADGRGDLATANFIGKSISLMHGIAEPIVGVSTFGTGTIGCQGKHGILTNGAPTVGNPNFGITSTNTPPTELGLGAYASFPDVVGTDVFLIGLLVHLDFATSPTVGLFDLHSDAGGSAFGPVPIPNFPWLVGSTYYFQTYWVFGPGDSCDPSPIGFSSSPGLAVTIQP